MAIEVAERYAVLLDGDMVCFREERVQERMVVTHESTKYPLEVFREMWPDVKIRGYSEDVQLNLREVPVAKLSNVLEDIKDRDLVKKFMDDDDRVTSKQHYIKRLEELGDFNGDAGEAG